ncbi:MAG: PIG-L family deacetylase [Saprospiraceae bacterium]|nr:MAG: LmbE family protein [Bacteroidetes bacterium OLB9]MCO6463317.1 PIG-L family deacetylase [Saprospiraceae bacterium]
MQKLFNLYFVVFLLFITNTDLLFSQKTKQPTSAEIYLQMEKLGVLGSALYVAAHPDDENTKLIAFLANDRKVFTTYLSLTRGDGGQNLIGPEMSELLGVIRTQELLQARSVDNGHQLFSRANDFGYSKNAEETIKIWDTDKVKADVVWAIRNTRPDVIINRFDHRSSGKTHGHHTASAMLSYELFEAAADPSVYPEQLKYVKPWKPQRLFFNTSWWFYGSMEKFNKADKTALLGINIGTYNPLLGKSYSEIAAESRSKHKCQGFGATGSRGEQLEYLELLKGDMPATKSDLFEGINTTWSRVEGGDVVLPLWQQLLREYDFKHPERSVPILTKIYEKIKLVKDQFWRNKKMAETKDLIAACLGLYMEAIADQHKVVPGDSLNISFEVTSRSIADITLQKVSSIGFEMQSTSPLKLKNNVPVLWTDTIKIPDHTAYTAPYWLTSPHELGLYTVEDQMEIGQPESKRALQVQFTYFINGVEIPFVKDVKYKYNSPENGETFRPLEIVPPLSVAVKEPVYIFANGSSHDVVVSVHAWTSHQKGIVSIPLPEGWSITPTSYEFELLQAGQSQDFTFRVTPLSNQSSEISITPVVQSSGKTYKKSIIDIHYDHIPYQVVLMESAARFSNIDIVTLSKKIAYVMGAGDEVPTSLKQIGCQVDLLKPEELQSDKLVGYDALVMGVRAYNTQEALKFKQPVIDEYIKHGGTVVVQYNTNSSLITQDIAPYPLTISRDRVTVEEADMRFLVPDHVVLNSPNKITSKDFEGWVQERGLYFPSQWDDAYTPVLSCNDPGESPKNGSLLIAKYGDGYYVYTGLSFFRELPAGVSGAYRLFANLISLGK